MLLRSVGLCALILSSAADIHDFAALIDKLPECSRLREFWQVPGNGIEQPYMNLMRRDGIARALVLTRASPGLSDIAVTREIYFKTVDGPEAPVPDDAVTTDLRAAVQKVAVERMAHAALASFSDESEPPQERQLTGYVTLYSNPWVPAYDPGTALWYRIPVRNGAEDALQHAASLGDVTSSAQLLKRRKYSQSELDSALFGASAGIIGIYDNSAVIAVLIGAGADVNAVGDEGQTPIFVALGCPCNLDVLLRYGARLDIKNRSGDTPLDAARRQGLAEASRILRGYQPSSLE